jgi:hypothetical protein
VAPGYKKKKLNVAAGPVLSFRKDFRYVDLETRNESYRSRRIGGMISIQLSNIFSLNYRLEQIEQTGMSTVFNQSGSLRFNMIF